MFIKSTSKQFVHLTLFRVCISILVLLLHCYYYTNRLKKSIPRKSAKFVEDKGSGNS